MAIIGDSDAHFSVAVQRELERQQQKNMEQRSAIARQQGELDSLLKDLGKSEQVDPRQPRRGDGSVLCYPLVADAPDVVTAKQVAESGAEVYGLVPAGSAVFPSCRAFARALPDAATRGATADLNKTVAKLTARVDALEDQNALRSLEIRVLRRILADHRSELRLNDIESDALSAVGSEAPPLPGAEDGEVGGSEEALEAQAKAVDALAREGLASLLRAVYREPRALRSLGRVPGV
eukprot:Hpha_TRINITY_DN28490_c0_g1::TRINITY_DN28490_c0_g1_i1::g.183970::m.183970